MGHLLYLFTVNRILIEAGRILSLQPWLPTVKAQTGILKVESAFKFKEQIPPENAVNSSIWDLVAARTSSLGTTCPLILQLMPPVQCTACYSTMTSLPRHFQLQQRDYGKPWGHDKKHGSFPLDHCVVIYLSLIVAGPIRSRKKHYLTILCFSTTLLWLIQCILKSVCKG